MTFESDEVRLAFFTTLDTDSQIEWAAIEEFLLGQGKYLHVLAIEASDVIVRVCNEFKLRISPDD